MRAASVHQVHCAIEHKSGTGRTHEILGEYGTVDHEVARCDDPCVRGVEVTDKGASQVDVLGASDEGAHCRRPCVSAQCDRACGTEVASDKYVDLGSGIEFYAKVSVETD